jgi:hypothetical protein
MAESMSTPPPPPPSGPPPSGPPPGPPSAGYPVVVDFQREDLGVANWRALVSWLLAIPHIVVLYGLHAVASVLWFLSFFMVLFTQRNPFVGFQTMVLRYQWRTLTYVMFMRDDYPPFDFATDQAGAMPDPAVLAIDEPGEMNRWLPLVKALLAIPHLIVLSLLGIAAFFVWIVAFFAVLFTGAWPKGMRDFMVGLSRWSFRVTAYVYFMTDDYPPFSLAA